MTSPGSPIGPDHDPLENYYHADPSQPVRWEAEGRGSGGPPKEPPDDKKGAFAAFFLLLLDKMLEFLGKAASKKIASESKGSVRENLIALTIAFETMMTEDRSQDSLFLKNLSQLWQKTLEQGLHIRPTSEVGIKLKAFIKEIESYPNKAEHTFGYYLDEYAGLKWLPFPYMELIQTLHHEHELSPSESMLTKWTGRLKNVLGHLNGE